MTDNRQQMTDYRLQKKEAGASFFMSLNRVDYLLFSTM